MQIPLTDLPSGLTWRPLTIDDAADVYEVIAAEERNDLGHAEIELADVLADWQRPSFEVVDSTVGVFDGKTLVAYAELSEAGRGGAAVLPHYQGRGIGARFAFWMQARGRLLGLPRLRIPALQGSPGDRLLAGLGYRQLFTSWVLELPPDAALPQRSLPPGYVARAAEAAEYPAVHRVLDDAFSEWTDRESYEDFIAKVVQRPGFEPWRLRVVADPAGVVVAAVVLIVAVYEDGNTEAYIDRIATRADRRNLGLAQALMGDAFAAGADHGTTAFGISTDTRTGALDLYLKVGMQVTQTWINWGMDLN